MTFDLDRVIRLHGGDCAAAVTGTSEQVWEPAAANMRGTSPTSRTDRGARWRRSCSAGGEESRRREASPKGSELKP
ncbi:hypothetical protein AMECASPLE_027856 [Ameca splendens]|uniref:Uncharacterized protein n=1 Tax=Ameca splendens TaxID=208324 RepID=A0ABV0ZQ60_9TELE